MRKIVSHPDILHGKPYFAGTNVTVASILDKIAKGASIKRISEQLPQLSQEDIVAGIKFAHDLCNVPLKKED
ncbi:MAG: DUF433 domain-containing protein [Candidatus Sericytochromatia bacterium]